MPPRVSALSEDLQAPAITQVLKAKARLLLLTAAFAGAMTYAALSLIAPRYESEAMIAHANPVELSVLAGLATGLFGLAWMLATTALRGMPKRQLAKRAPVPEPTLAVKTEVANAPPSDEEKLELAAPSANMTAALSPVAETRIQPTAFTEIEKLAIRLKTKRPSGGGHRALVTSQSEDVIPYEQALDLAKTLAGCGAQTILIDWSPSGDGFANAIGFDGIAGWNELLQSRASFDEIIHRLPGSHAQVIASGAPVPHGRRKMDADMLNLTLDALDEVYDHIIVTARHGDARTLFECIEGRFDAGITVEPNGDGTASLEDGNTFLGFEVADIDVLRYRRAEQPASSMAQRIARATRQREVAVQRA